MPVGRDYLERTTLTYSDGIYTLQGYSISDTRSWRPKHPADRHTRWASPSPRSRISCTGSRGLGVRSTESAAWWRMSDTALTSCSSSRPSILRFTRRRRFCWPITWSTVRRMLWRWVVSPRRRFDLSSWSSSTGISDESCPQPAGVEFHALGAVRTDWDGQPPWELRFCRWRPGYARSRPGSLCRARGTNRHGRYAGGGRARRLPEHTAGLGLVRHYRALRAHYCCSGLAWSGSSAKPASCRRAWSVLVPAPGFRNPRNSPSQNLIPGR